jgi:hypothetical protein
MPNPFDAVMFVLLVIGALQGWGGCHGEQTQTAAPAPP